MILLLARRFSGMSNGQLGIWAGHLYDSAVRQTVRRLQQRMETTPVLNKTTISV
jgi:hypothetical protein